MTDIHDIKPILMIGTQWPWLPWLAAVPALLAVVLLIFRFRRRPADVDTVQPDPAAEALGRLDTLAHDTEMPVRLYYFRLSSILRVYMAQRLALPATHMTHEELLPRMAGLPLPPALNHAFKEFGHVAEAIKFGQHTADPDIMARHLTFARTFVTQTAQQPNPNNPTNSINPTNPAA